MAGVGGAGQVNGRKEQPKWEGRLGYGTEPLVKAW